MIDPLQHGKNSQKKIISDYLSESEITAKGKLYQQKQWPVSEAAVNLTPIATYAGENTDEILLQIFDLTVKNDSALTKYFQCSQKERIFIYW